MGLHPSLVSIHCTSSSTSRVSTVSPPDSKARLESLQLGIKICNPPSSMPLHLSTCASSTPQINQPHLSSEVLAQRSAPQRPPSGGRSSPQVLQRNCSRRSIQLKFHQLQGKGADCVPLWVVWWLAGWQVMVVNTDHAAKHWGQPDSKWMDRSAVGFLRAGFLLSNASWLIWRKRQVTKSTRSS